MKPIILFFVIAVVITIILFRGGNLLGGGESGVPFYNLKRMLEISSSPWSDVLLGVYIPHVVVNIPFFAALSFLQNIGIPGYLLQATFFFLLIFLSTSSMYLLSKSLFPNASKWSWILAALFYLFNLYSLMNIWNRYLLNFMLFYAFLPLVLSLFIHGLKVRSYFFGFLVAFSTALFSYSLSAPSQLLILWFLLLIAAVFYLIYFRSKFTIGYFLLTLFLSITFNFWWLLQLFYFNYSQAFQNINALFRTSSGNQETFNALSHTLGKLSNLWLLKHGTFFTQPQDLPFDWPLIYSNPLALTLEWIVVLSTLYFAIKYSRNIWVRFLLCLFLIGIFISKGNSPPFGEILDFLFKKISLLQFFRNPFEKLGILLPLVFSPLFGLAMIHYFKIRKMIVILLIPYLFVFLGFPFFTGLVFTSGNPPANDLRVNYEVKIPEYYNEANLWLSSQKDIFRFISFPLGGEGIFNKWPKGYVGVEESAFLFSTPNISYNVGFPYYHEIVNDLEKLFITHDDFYKLAGLLNIRYILLRPDLDFQLSGMRDPLTIEKILEERSAKSSSNLSLAKTFGPLKFYRFSDDVLLPKVYSAKGVINSNSISNLEDILFTDAKLGDVIYNAESKVPAVLEQNESTKIIHTNAIFQIIGPDYPKLTSPYIFPHVTQLPNSFWYPAVLLKEKFETLTYLNPTEKVSREIFFLSKRLIEVRNSLKSNDFSSAKKALDLYQKSFFGVLPKIVIFSKSMKQPNEQIWNESYLREAFSNHFYLLNEFEKTDLNNTGYVTNFLKEFHQNLITIKILPKYNINTQSDFPIENRIVFQLLVPKSGEYQILTSKSKILPESFSITDKIPIQIDDSIEKRQTKIEGNYLSFGTIDLQEGLHEISFNQLQNELPINLPREFTIEAEDGQKVIEVPFPNFNPYGHYDISFDYWTRYGDGVTFAISLNTDLESKKPNKPNHALVKKLSPDDYNFDYKSYSTTFFPNLSADSAKFIFSVNVWNNCQKFFSIRDLGKCEIQKFKKLFDRPTSVIIRNFKIIPKVPRTLFLLYKQEGKIITPQKIEMKKINSTKYRINVSGAATPFLLVFSELYDSNWKAYLEGYPISDDKHFLLNGYANGWWINKTGDFDIILEFLPQRLLYWGSLVSIITIILTSGYFALKYSRNKYES